MILTSHQAVEGDRLRAEVSRYRERMEDFEYLKKQVEVSADDTFAPNPHFHASQQELKERNMLLAQQNINLKGSQQSSDSASAELGLVSVNFWGVSCNNSCCSGQQARGQRIAAAIRNSHCVA